MHSISLDERSMQQHHGTYLAYGCHTSVQHTLPPGLVRPFCFFRFQLFPSFLMHAPKVQCDLGKAPSSRQNEKSSIEPVGRARGRGPQCTCAHMHACARVYDQVHACEQCRRAGVCERGCVCAPGVGVSACTREQKVQVSLHMPAQLEHTQLWCIKLWPA